MFHYYQRYRLLESIDVQLNQSCRVSILSGLVDIEDDFL